MRWEGFSSLMKPSVIKNVNRAKARGVKGNLKGEGRLLGGLLVVDTSGVAFEHREAVSKGLASPTVYRDRAESCCFFASRLDSYCVLRQGLVLIDHRGDFRPAATIFKRMRRLSLTPPANLTLRLPGLRRSR